MPEIQRDAPGPCLVLAWPQTKQTPEAVQAVFAALLKPDRMYKSALEGWMNPKWTEERQKRLLDRTQMPRIDHWWEQPRPGAAITNEAMMTYYLDPAFGISGPKKTPLRINAEDILSVWGYHSQVPDKRKAMEVVATFRKIVNVMEPPFALIDHFALNVKKRQGDELRQYAWGVTIYGPVLVKLLGKETLFNAKSWKVEELPWGGVWLQLDENPFTVDAKKRQALEKHLGLKERLGEGAKSAR